MIGIENEMLVERANMPETKLCKGCADNRPLEEFKSDRRSADNLSVLCESCRKDRERPLVSTGVDEQMYEHQDRCCAICKSPVFKTQILIDRDPLTGKVVGLLCRDCNRMLRYAGRSSRRFKAAIEYLCPPKSGDRRINEKGIPEVYAKAETIRHTLPPPPVTQLRPRY